MNDITCTYGAPLTDAELLMALDNQAAPEVAMHLSHCPGCQQQARQLNGQQQVLAASLFRSACPPSLELGEYQMGLLSPEQSVAIARHASKCPHCTQEIESLVAFMTQPDPLTQPTALQTASTRLRVLVAQLVGGARSAAAAPALAPALAGLRGDDDGPLTYEAGAAQVILDVQRDEQRAGRKAIFGLVLGLADPAATVHLWRDQQPVCRAPVDSLGNFFIADLAPGQYELFVTGDSDEIHIQDLSV
jgi:hypothetical protein